MAQYQDTVRDELVYQLSCGEDGAARLSESVLNRTQHVARRGAVSSHPMEKDANRYPSLPGIARQEVHSIKSSQSQI